MIMKFAALPILVLWIFLASVPSLAEEPTIRFTPRNGFSGQSEGNGVLTLFMGKRRYFHVQSREYDQSNGTFRLDQTITFEGQASQERSWILKANGQNQYTATLSDAAGPVSGVSDGSRLQLQYRIKGPLFMHQTLELMPDGKTIDNAGKITLLGIPVGHLQETITRQDQALVSRPIDDPGK